MLLRAPRLRRARPASFIHPGRGPRRSGARVRRQVEEPAAAGPTRSRRSSPRRRSHARSRPPTPPTRCSRRTARTRCHPSPGTRTRRCTTCTCASTSRPRHARTSSPRRTRTTRGNRVATSTTRRPTSPSATATRWRYGRWTRSTRRCCRRSRTRTASSAGACRDLEIDGLSLPRGDEKLSPLSRALSAPSIERRHVEIDDLFCVKYTAAPGGQASLPAHRDDSLLSFSILLSEPGVDFAGGGTRFDALGGIGGGRGDGVVVAPAHRGGVVLHSSKLLPRPSPRAALPARRLRRRRPRRRPVRRRHARRPSRAPRRAP